ncbi:colicin E3-like toxin immunity protein [Serratia sp. M24T3]|uniref:colicin E3-like toxin immunity protein n=1 Tax=Serratia sp. M24T3 TaxID=932213 RepID=UPI00025BB8FB|nr:colicin E3-like toxin immunity protein [Serratia sp. M24T3]EIC86324.1 putative colicin-E3 immunity protein [Serratia sp. M24T3]
MSYKMRLQWFNKENFDGEGKEFSAILDDNVYLLDKLGLSTEPRIYDGAYNISNEWLYYIQPYFQHQINLQQYDYQLAFRHV